MPRPSRSPRATAGRRRRLLALAAVAAVALLVGVLAGRGAGGDAARRVVPAELRAAGLEALAYDPARREELEARAAAGLSHVLYAKSPDGALASAQRTARFRGLVDRTARRYDLDADTLEALVLLESAGRPDARASDDLQGAAGLTQILAQTATGLLGMRVDVARSERLTRAIARGRRVKEREAERRRVDERFDPAKALDATGRYLVFAKSKLGDRDDLAIASYHMGVGNLQDALARYGAGDVPYAQLYFDSSPLRHAPAWAKLASLGDDSSTYLWRIGAAREIMRLYRDDRSALVRLQDLHARADSAQAVLHPPDRTPEFATAEAAAAALDAGTLVALQPADLARHGLRATGAGPADLRALRPEALAALRLLGDGTAAIGRARPLVVRSTLATEPTGWSFDIARRYRSGAQAQAFQFLLDRLQALDLIAWARRPDTIHVTVSGRAEELVVSSAGQRER
ncbi:MAG TPA: transglycosylase SLT domain-containing protein [Solirubrobacteraceae bacterium]|nr:transglycosylase SLT domain-containing protein [Solirubrobacteraceae bacterium]